MPSTMIDISEIRDKLAHSEGPAYWRSLEELSASSGFREALTQEFPSFATRWDDADGVSRRKLLKIMGASLALMGLNGCFYKRPQGKLVPYPNPPQETVPGRPVYFATAMPFCGFGKGVLALSQEGRPTKIEGNPDHPASLGATDVFMQASVLDLYDPDRSRSVKLAGEISRWGDFQDALEQQLARMPADGSGLRILTGTITSPTLVSQLQALLKRYPAAVRHEYEPARLAAAGPFTEPADTIYELRPASVVVSLGSDFMFRDAGSVRYARHFVDGRRVRASSKKMNRLYVVESTMSLTGSIADHRIALPPSRIESVARALAAKFGVGGLGESNLPDNLARRIDAMAADLSHPAEGGATLVIAGATQPPAVHALAHLINQKLENVGKTVFYTEPVALQGGRTLNELAADMLDGKVQTLLMIGVNPAYNAPADVPMADALHAMTQRGKFTATLATHYDETSYLCQWHVPKTHYLETWGDVRAFDGTASIIQPLIAPLYGAHCELELLDTLLGRRDRTPLEIVRSYWQSKVPAADLEQWWVRSLQKGTIENTASAHRAAPALKSDALGNGLSPSPGTPVEGRGEGDSEHQQPSASKSPSPQPSPGVPREGAISTPPSGIEILFEPDPSAWDGEFANNAWLQEIPRPFTKLTWDNAVGISLRMAERWPVNGQKMLQDGDVIRIDYKGRQIEAPVILLPGQADNLITLYLGYGRARGGEVMLEDGKPRGYSAYALRTSDAPWAGTGATITPADKFHFLVVTRNHHAMSIHAGVPGVEPWLKPEVIAEPGDSESDLEIENRKIVRTATLAEFQNDSDVIKHLDPEGEKKPLLSLYPGWDYDHGLQWGMSIDMTACMGCNACIVACQAENNIPVVGKDEVSQQREMHWIRIDDYFAGDIDAPMVHHQPVPCMHCENAPCEYVCPVGATSHSDEGINEMTYNRCIGTRYCSNNCPYKVRRFNFFLYSDYEHPTLKLLHNPDVTVRSRGVMEKCNYCVQRIDRTRIEMEKEVLALQEQARAMTDPQQRDRLMEQATQRGVQIVRQLQTACQQSCPTQAIVFGDIRDAGSGVTRLKKEPTNYGLLTDLTTKPRTTYLARLTNPNPAMPTGKTA